MFGRPDTIGCLTTIIFNYPILLYIEVFNYHYLFRYPITIVYLDATTIEYPISIIHLDTQPLSRRILTCPTTIIYLDTITIGYPITIIDLDIQQLLDVLLYPTTIRYSAGIIYLDIQLLLRI